MKKERKNFNKNAQMHLACEKNELRPAFACVHFKDGFAYASDGMILVRNPISEISTFDKQEAAALDGKSLHMDFYKDMLKYDEVLISEDGVECHKENGKAFFYFTETKMPAFEKVLQDTLHSSTVNISEVGFNMALFQRLNKAIGGKNETKMTFKGARKSIIVEPCDDTSSSIGLLMPILVG